MKLGLNTSLEHCDQWLMVLEQKQKGILHLDANMSKWQVKLLWAFSIRFSPVLQDLFKESCVCNKLPCEFISLQLWFATAAIMNVVCLFHSIW